jgi:hypothetical protein
MAKTPRTPTVQQLLRTLGLSASLATSTVGCVADPGPPDGAYRSENPPWHAPEVPPDGPNDHPFSPDNPPWVPPEPGTDGPNDRQYASENPPWVPDAGGDSAGGSVDACADVGDSGSCTAPDAGAPDGG